MDKPSIMIERAENGFEVEVKDPDIIEKNNNSDRWRDPCVSFVFKTLEEVQTFLTENAEKYMAAKTDAYAEGFNKATKGDM